MNKKTEQCAVEGCEKPAKTRGWCSAHYERWRRNGDPGPAGDGRKRPLRLCVVDGCERPTTRRSGFCSMHHARWQRHGDPLVSQRPNYGTGRRVRTDGYVMLWMPGHALAGRSRYVAEHRLVLFDAGYGLEPSDDVHHINGDKQDNRLENLEIVSRSEHASKHLTESGVVSNQYGTWPVIRDEKVRNRTNYLRQKSKRRRGGAAG